MSLKTGFKKTWLALALLALLGSAAIAILLPNHGDPVPLQEELPAPTDPESRGMGTQRERGPVGEQPSPFPCTLKIPSLGLEFTVQEGSHERWRIHVQLRQGPVHLPWTSPPGGEGNCVISGHRTTYTRPFHRLDEVKEGDEIIIGSAGSFHVYRVYKVFQVGHWVDVTGYTVAPILTLTTCAPKGSSSQRLVVRASYEGVKNGQR